MDRAELADFLRSARARIRPEDVGLEAGGRRRTPGLRREEVARLAAISVDYYARLEQARGPHPSPAVISGLARALRLSDSERRYLTALATDAAPSGPDSPPSDVPSGILHLLDRLDDTPAYVTDMTWDILAWNPMAAALVFDFSTLPPDRRSALRWMYELAESEAGLDPDQLAIAREAVADLRAALVRYPDDPRVRARVRELRAVSAFERIWQDHGVRTKRSLHKHVEHPVVGTISLDVETLLIPEVDMRLVLYTAPTGTVSRERLALLRVVGIQDLRPSEPLPDSATRR